MEEWSESKEEWSDAMEVWSDSKSVTVEISNPNTVVQLANLIIKQKCPPPQQSVPEPFASFQSPTLITESRARGYCIPSRWACTGDIVEYVQWFNVTYNMQYSNELLIEWRTLERVLAFIQDKWRPIVIQVLHEDDPQFKSLQRGSCNVAQQGLTWTLEENTRKVTGCDFIVQAMYVGQAATIEILSAAIREMELEHLNKYTFACTHATHRSVACAVLLAMIAYPKAEIFFSTPRTKREALECGLLLAE